MDKKDLEKMNSMKWYHRIRLPDGTITPGNKWEHLWDPLRQEMEKTDFTGKKVLEIGCWDGMWSFEAEKLGASEVWATDLVCQRSFSKQKFETLEFAKKHLNSQVKCKEVSIYELDKHFSEEFDVVICFGVLYHLRYPQLGVANIRNVLKDNGLALLETAVVLGTKDTVIQTDYKKINPHDVSTWNAFSKAALTDLMLESYLIPEEFRVILTGQEDMKTGQGFVGRILGGRQGNKIRMGRGFVRARAFFGKNPHHYFADPFLKKYFTPVDFNVHLPYPVTGFLTPEGPYPQWKLPLVRWGIFPESQIVLPDKLSGNIEVILSARSKPGSKLLITLNDTVVYRHVFSGDAFEDMGLSLSVAPGIKRLCFKYDGIDNNVKDKLSQAVLFQDIRIRVPETRTP